MRSDAGRGPALVYVPGIDGTGEFLLGTAARLEQHFRLVRLAYRETGGPWATGSPYDELALSVDREVASLGLGRVLSLAESFGGALSLAWALRARERVRGLAIVNGFAHFSRRGSLLRARLAAPLLSPALFRFGRRLFARHVLLSPRRDEDVWRRFREVGGRAFDAGYRERLRMVVGLDLRPRLRELEQPVFLYAADHDRIVASVSEAREMERLLPDARVTVLERAGHLVLPLREEPWPERLLELARVAPQ